MITTSPILEYRLPNCMRVLVQEVHSAPIATSWMWYRVGSRYEHIGQTGISHWVEHMLFKGTPNMPKGTIDRAIARNGGVLNGFTSIDYTAYFETLPADRIELALEIESDRMVNSLFDPEEVESERTVILSEREGYENDPETWLDEAVKAASFVVHPYHNPVIGFKSDLLHLTRDELFAHYQTYYKPNNAVLVLVGDFDAETMLKRVEHYFADLPVGLPFTPPHAVEPEQQGERRVIIRRPGPTQYVLISYHTPDCRHPDFVPLLVLDAVMSGAKSLTSAREVRTNRSARIYKALVETELASSAGSAFPPSFDPYLFEFYATVRTGHHAAEVEAAFRREIERIQQEGVTDEELARVIKQVRAQMAYGSERVTNQGLLLGMWEMLDSYRRAEHLLDEIAAVRKEDVQRVAQTYLIDQHGTIGYFIPTPAAEGDAA